MNDIYTSDFDFSGYNAAKAKWDEANARLAALDVEDAKRESEKLHRNIPGIMSAVDDTNTPSLVSTDAAGDKQELERQALERRRAELAAAPAFDPVYFDNQRSSVELTSGTNYQASNVTPGPYQGVGDSGSVDNNGGASFDPSLISSGMRDVLGPTMAEQTRLLGEVVVGIQGLRPSEAQ
jgi:hypothetical protein